MSCECSMCIMHQAVVDADTRHEAAAAVGSASAHSTNRGNCWKLCADS